MISDHQLTMDHQWYYIRMIVKVKRMKSKVKNALL